MEDTTVNTNVMTTKTRTEFNLFDGNDTSRYLGNKGIKILSEKTDVELLENNDDNSQTAKTYVDTSKTDGKSCILCGMAFLTLEEQRGHFKLDWHKYNIKQKLLQRDPVKEDVFEEMIAGELSSISGSDSESDEQAQTTSNPENVSLMTLSLLPNERKILKNESIVNRSNPKVYFVNESGIHMSVYREVVYGSKEDFTSQEVELRIQNLPQKKFWLILMTGGGHFAGAIFSGNDVVVSKTFHRYTVRAKRGTAQAMRDNKQGGYAPRSAGASLRRYNEAALVQDIQNLLESWSKDIEKCNTVFMRVPSNYKWIFFAGKKPAFVKDDLRIRVIPFATRRATFKELKNVHRKLSTIVIDENYMRHRTKEKFENKDKIMIDLPGSEKQETKTCSLDTLNAQTIFVDNESHERELETINNSFQDVSKTLRLKKNKKKTNKGDKKKKEVIPEIWIKLYDVVNSGNVEKTTNVIEKLQEYRHKYPLTETQESSTENKTNFKIDENMISQLQNNEVKITNNEDVKHGEMIDCITKMQEMLNLRFETYGETVLHVASRLGHADIVKALLEAGANPTIKGSEGSLPYNVAKDKRTRNAFRRFMAAYPDEYDYNEARIPSALTAEMDEKERQKTAGKKKAQSKARKERLKAKKAEERQKEEERLKKEKAENEKKWFQNLSDREKRAVAAERRLGNICFNCGKSLQGLVPFERLSNKYCSTECVQNHRHIMETAVK